MILTSGNPAWPHTLHPIPQYPMLNRDLDCDCLIVGGGMSGAILTYELARRNIRTVTIEKRTVGGGSTSANTGLLQILNDKTLTSIIHTFGEETGVKFYKLCEQAMQKLNTAVKGLDPDPEFIPRPSLYYASYEEDVKLLREEYATLRKYGFNAEFWDQAKIEKHMPFSKPAALYTQGDAEVNPTRLIHALFQGAIGRGAQVYEHTEAIHFEYGKQGVTCDTRTNKIRADNVVFTTGYETQDMKKDKNAILKVSYAMMTNPVEDLSDWHEQCLIWETARPYLYFRTARDRRILAGGFDEEPPPPEKWEARSLHFSRYLLDEIRKLFPRYEGLKADYHWAGIFGSTHDGLPMIGTHPDYPYCYFVEAYGGNGTVYCMMAADMLGDVLTGQKRPEMEMFSLQRTSKPSPPKS